MKVTTAACFLLLAALYGAYSFPAASAAPTKGPACNGTSNSTSTPTTQPPTQELPASGFNCSAPGEGEDHMLATGFLIAGLEVLLQYSTELYLYRGSNTGNCKSISQQYLFPGSSFSVWNSTAMLEGYVTLAKLAKDNSSDQSSQQQNATGLYDILSAVLGDLKTVISHEYCQCESCYEVTLSPPVELLPECSTYQYLARYVAEETLKAIYSLPGIPFTSVKKDKWIESRLSSSSPAYMASQS